MGMPDWVLNIAIYPAGAALLALIGRWLILESLIPTVRAQINRVPNLNDTVWENRREEGQGARAKLSFKQRGDTIRCEATYYSSPERLFSYKGFVRGDQLVMTWEEKGLSAVNVGSMVVRLSGDGRRLIGYTTYLHRERGEVLSDQRIFYRVP